MDSSSAVRKFLAIKHSWRGQYNRIFNLGNNVFQTLDPKTMNVTNAWEYKQVMKVTVSADDPNVFTLTLPKEGGLFSGGQEEMKFSCPHRTSLLTEMHRLLCSATGRGKPAPVSATKVTRTDQRRLCNLTLAPQGVLVHADDASGKLLSEYLYKDIKKLQKVQDDPTGFLLFVCGRGRIFLVQNRDAFIAQLATNAAELGLDLKVDSAEISMFNARAARAR